MTRIMLAVFRGVPTLASVRSVGTGPLGACALLIAVVIGFSGGAGRAAAIDLAPIDAGLVQLEDAYGWVNPDPSARSGHAMTYDSESDRVIMFGSGETWSYDFNANTWMNMAPSDGPSARSYPAVAYDSESDRVILFGGGAPSSPTDETWSYDFNTNSWTSLSPSGSPLARRLHAMAYDSASDRVILFGGFSSGSTHLNDTWEYDFNTNTWTDLAPSGSPSPRYGHAMAYHPGTDRVILFGGLSNAPPGVSNATWSYDRNTNGWTRLSPSSSPAPRYQHAMAYDAQSDRMILFGGGSTFLAYGDTWALDAATAQWTGMAPAKSPVPRFGPAIAYDGESDRTILFRGGSSKPAAFPNPKDTWAYDLEADAWSLQFDSPPPVRQHALAHDSESDRTILFGGWLLVGLGTTDATWAYDVEATLWTRLEPSIRPKYRFGHAMAYDSESDRVIMFGGCCVGSFTGLADTWAYDFNTNTWTDMAPATTPAGRFGHAMAYDSESDRVIMFGSGETWSYDYNTNTWALLTSLISPSARSGHAMAYDSKSDRVVLFGGSGSGETWSYDFNTNLWILHLPLTGPSARSDHGMAYDLESDRTILFGGDTVAGPSGETWTYDLETNMWTSLSPENPPSPRSRHGMAYDSHSDRTVLFGGNGDDTWLFHHESSFLLP